MAKSIKDLIGPSGGNWVWMIKNSRLIGEFIKANNLKPSTVRPVDLKVTTKPAVGPIIDLGGAGGIKAAHVHFNSHVYLLNRTQWNKLSATIVADATARLSKAGQIGFEQGMLVGSVAEIVAPR